MPLTRTDFIAIPSGRGMGFDHADVYQDSSDGSRIYVAHTGADRVDVIDCATNTWLRSLPDHPAVAGVLIDNDNDLLLTSDRASSQVSVYRCSDEKLLGRVGVGEHPNGLAFDPARVHLFSFNLGEPLGQSCTASVVDLDSQQVVASLGLPGRPRWAAYDAETDQVFVNIRKPAQILVIGGDSLEVRRAIDVPADGPHGLWIVGERLWCAADGSALVVLDRDSGHVEAILPLPGAPDVVMHDPEQHHLYVAIGDPGLILVADTEALKVIETVTTEPGAHTLAIAPDRHAVYAFLPASSGAAVYLDQ
jgi:serine/threonine-protein kinase